jgi:hypothetical protein
MTGTLLTPDTLRTSAILSLFFALGCGAQTGETADPGNGGRAHWFQSCDDDAECGSLECLSRVCTRACSDAEECSDLDPAAQCGGEAGATVCLAACVGDGCTTDVPYDPCAGKACGDDCRRCAPNDATCYETEEPKSCDEEGRCGEPYNAICDTGCVGDECTPSAPYDACVGKACGEDCRLCAPDDATCDETLEPKNCNQEGRCDDSFDAALCDEPDAGAGLSGSSRCEALTAPSPDPNLVEVTVRNDRDVALLLDSPISCGGSIYLGVESLNDESPGGWYGGFCFFGCDTALTEPLGCDPFCPTAEPLVVRPGESVRVAWAGLLTETVDAPSECCTLSDNCPDTCSLVRAAQPGAYLATLALTNLTDSEADECEQVQNLSCLPSVGSSEQLERVEVEFELGEDPIVLMVR